MRGTQLNEIKTNLRDTVRFLAGTIGSRCYAEIENLEKAASFIEKGFKARGLEPERQSYNARGNEYHNIFSTVRGTGPSDEIIVIGAHYDTVHGTPGADDNASGIAGMLELARLAAENPCPSTIAFAAFTLEEPPFFRTDKMGSYVFAGHLHRKNTRLKGMISLEMIGYYSEAKGSQYYPIPLFRWIYPNSGNYIAFVGNFRSKAFTDRFSSVFRNSSSLQVESLNAVSLVPGVDFSDHLSFWRFHYPAFMITDTAFYRNPHYHAPSDTAESLDYEKMAELIIGISKTLKQI